MKKKQEPESAAAIHQKKPADGFGKARILAPETASNPIKRGKKSEPSHWMLEFDGKEIHLSRLLVGSLAAIASGIDNFKEIQKAYDFNGGATKASAIMLQLHGLIERKSTDKDDKGGLWMDCPYKLTKNGEDAVKIIRERGTFFTECETWLRERRQERIV